MHDVPVGDGASSRSYVRKIEQAVCDHPSVCRLTGGIKIHGGVNISVAIKEGHPALEVADELRKLVRLVAGHVPITIDITESQACGESTTESS